MIRQATRCRCSGQGFSKYRTVSDPEPTTALIETLEGKQIKESKETEEKGYTERDQKDKNKKVKK
jgi:hypothetical protein